jgi:hypothetical protein
MPHRIVKEEAKFNHSFVRAPSGGYSEEEEEEREEGQGVECE